MAQERLQYNPDQALMSAACYQFALSGSSDQDTLDSIDTRFSAIGNYMLAGVEDNLDQLKVLRKADLDRLVAIQTEADRRKQTMIALCTEFALSQSDQAVPPCNLGGRFKEGQMLPEHMWVNDGQYSYDTMPNQTIFKDVDPYANKPPLERDIPADEICTIGLSELTVFQQILIQGPWV